MEMNKFRTEDSRRWFTVATDPFHDNDVPLAGLPDNFTGDTVVKCIKQKFTFTKPSDLGAGTWSLHAFTLPLLDNVNARYFENRWPNEPMPAAAAHENVGPINFRACLDSYGYTTPNASSSYIGAIAALNVSPSVALTSLDMGDGKSPQRIIAGGFEAHNDTSPMHRSGSCTVYSMNNPFTDGYARTTDDLLTTARLGAVKRARLPPASAAEAAQLHDARTWTAEQGCYVPIRLNLQSGVVFPPMTNSGLVLSDRDFTQSSDTCNGYVSIAYRSTSGDPAIDQSWFWSHIAPPTGAGTHGFRPANIDTSGAFFSGLSEETVLTISTRIFVEVAPTFYNTDILAIASPSAGPDMLALQCYLHCISTLPPGVPVGDNEKGAWWRVVRQVLAKVAPAVGKVAGAALGQPELAVIGEVVGGLAAMNLKKKPNNKTKTTGVNPNSRRTPPRVAVVKSST